MARIATLALVLLFAPAAPAALMPGEREEFEQALDVLSRGADTEAASRARELFRRPDASAAELEGVLASWFAERPSTEPLAQWLHYAALGEPEREARERVQQALAGALVASLAASFEALLPDALGPALASDPALLEDLRTRLQLLGELAWRADGLSGPSRRAHVARLERLVRENPSVLRADVTLDVSARPRLAILRAQPSRSCATCRGPSTPTPSAPAQASSAFTPRSCAATESSCSTTTASTSHSSTPSSRC